jgi:aspartyl/asparaginyl beta-hydroxylase (cupin superfamily)
MRLWIWIILFLLIIFILIILIRTHADHLYRSYINLASIDSLDPFPHIYNRRCIQDLQNAYPMIKHEMLKNKHLFSSIQGDQFFDRTITNDGNWQKIYLKWYSKPPKYAYKLFPETMKVLDRNPDIHLAMFSRLKPRAKILPHQGPFPGCIRGHLALITPDTTEDCFIKIAGTKYSWKEGEIVTFNDCFIHEVQNNTDQERIVLFVDIERKTYLPWINQWVIKHIASKTTRINDEIEKACSVSE